MPSASNDQANEVRAHFSNFASFDNTHSVNTDFSDYEQFVNNTISSHSLLKENFVAGRLQHFISEWEKLTSDDTILQTVKGFYIPFISTPIQLSDPKPIKWDSNEHNIICEQIERLLSHGVITKTGREEGDFVSNVFLRPKPGGKFRMILNLKELNKFIPYQHFKMESLLHAISMMSPSCWMASVDLADAYYSVPIALEHQKYLKFCFNGKFYQFTCFPNGLGCAPLFYTKMLKPVYASLRLKSHESVIFIDDSFLKAQTTGQCMSNVVSTVTLLQHLGFVIHPEKSVLFPTQEICFLGFILNSITMTVRLTDTKIVHISDMCKQLLYCTNPVIRFVCEVIGLLVSALPGVMYGKLYYRSLEFDRNQALTFSRGNYDKNMTLSSDSLSDLRWWIDSGVHSSCPINHDDPTLFIETDASKKGWGGIIPASGVKANGMWTTHESEMHINYLELKAILFTLQSLCNHMEKVHIRVMCDNTCAVSYLSQFGGCESFHCNSMARTIWFWAIKRDIWISAAFIPGKLNERADLLSRSFNPDTEWKLCPTIFKEVCSKLQCQPNIDLFASRINYQIKPYVSYSGDPECYAVDAFTLVNWGQWLFYAFPPFSIIGRVLQKVIRDKASGIIVVPNWPTQSWYPTLIKMLLKPSLFLSRKKKLLISPLDPTATHRLHHQMDLLVCHISGHH